MLRSVIGAALAFALTSSYAFAESPKPWNPEPEPDRPLYLPELPRLDFEPRDSGQQATPGTIINEAAVAWGLNTLTFAGTVAAFTLGGFFIGGAGHHGPDDYSGIDSAIDGAAVGFYVGLCAASILSPIASTYAIRKLSHRDPSRVRLWPTYLSAVLGTAGLSVLAGFLIPSLFGADTAAKNAGTISTVIGGPLLVAAVQIAVFNSSVSDIKWVAAPMALKNGAGIAMGARF